MIKVLVKILSAVLLVALVILAFIKILPWALAIIAVVATMKIGHDWLCRQGLSPSTWLPWKKDSGQEQQSTSPQ